MKSIHAKKMLTLQKTSLRLLNDHEVETVGSGYPLLSNLNPTVGNFPSLNPAPINTIQCPTIVTRNEEP